MKFYTHFAILCMLITAPMRPSCSNDENRNLYAVAIGSTGLLTGLGTIVGCAATQNHNGIIAGTGLMVCGTALACTSCFRLAWMRRRALIAPVPPSPTQRTSTTHNQDPV